MFSQQINKIKDDAKKQDMKAFVENSYDSSEQIQEIIDKVPAGGKRMYLDLDSLGQGGVNLTRLELLEVSRSCHSSVMAKLATILTHIKVSFLAFYFLIILSDILSRRLLTPTSNSAPANDPSLSTCPQTKSSNSCRTSSFPVQYFPPDLHTSWPSCPLLWVFPSCARLPPTSPLR